MSFGGLLSKYAVCTGDCHVGQLLLSFAFLVLEKVFKGIEVVPEPKQKPRSSTSESITLNPLNPHKYLRVTSRNFSSVKHDQLESQPLTPTS